MNFSAKILIVDDYVLMRTTLHNLLKGLGFDQVALVASGQEAIEYLNENTVDCVISDWNMPELSGLQLLRYVRAHDGLCSVPFMLITSESSRDYVDAAISAGVSEFVVKPFTAEMLSIKMQRMLSGAGRLPPPPAAETHSAPVVKSPELRETVLVVDDVPDNIEIIAGMLRDDYQVKAAISGEKALQIVSGKSPPDLILLDVMMPELDGFEVCRRLKADPASEHIPVIFLTAVSDAEEVAGGLQLGAVDYVIKPANPGVLLARVATHLRLKRARDDLSERIDALLDNARLREDIERVTRHDLKNPLAAVMQSTENLLDGSYLRAEQRDAVEVIRDATRSVLDMINRSLDLYKIESGTYQLKAEPLDLASLTQQVVIQARIAALKSGISIIFNAPESCSTLGEESLCYSMLGNLIVNAVEASPNDGEVVVRLTEEGGFARLAIHNLGAVDQAVKKNFFDKYATAGKSSGTGLGTYSARLMARVQNGDVELASSDSGGTTVTVSLPLKEH